MNVKKSCLSFKTKFKTFQRRVGIAKAKGRKEEITTLPSPQTKSRWKERSQEKLPRICRSQM